MNAAMSINLQLPKLTDLRPRITVIGVGGAGGNALNNMIATGLTGVEFVAANTDAQHLALSSAEHRIQLGVNLTEGLGAGSKPEIGESAAEEAVDEIRQQLSGSHMCFIAAGMGGGTGTGAAAVVARVAKELDILTVGVVTKPFQFEGARRMRVAEAGVAELRKYVDTLIVIPNQNLFRIANEKTTFAEAFRLADQVLHSGIACIVDLIVREGLINLDFADVRTVMRDMGSAMMGTGEGRGERRAVLAAEEAIHNPLLDDVSLKGAKGLLLSITGGRNLTLYEVDEAASRVRQEVDPEANIIVGATFDDTLTDCVRVSIVASGVDNKSSREGRAPSYQSDHAYREPFHRRFDTVPGAAAPQTLKHEVGLPPQAAGAPVTEPGRASFQPAARAPHHADNGDDEPLDLGSADEIAPDRNPWRSSSDVTIVEDLPLLAQSADFQRSPPMDRRPTEGDAGHGHQGAAPFKPAPPVDMRQFVSRMPAVDDFPLVGRRDYYAKMPQTKAEAGSRPAANKPGEPVQQASRPQPQAERRRGFFERWTGGGQRTNHESVQAPARTDSERSLPNHRNEAPAQPVSIPSRTVPAPIPPPPRSSATDYAGHRPLPMPQAQRVPAKNPEDVELPMFFQKSGK